MYQSDRLEIGAISTVPFFNEFNNFIDDTEHLLCIEGNAITIDETLFFTESVQLARRVLEIYKKYHDDFVEHISGSFNVVIYNKHSNTLKIFNDHFGYSFLYYYLDKDVFIFGPEAKLFLHYNKFDKKLNEKAIASFLSSKVILGNDTFFEKIHLLPQASILEVKNGNVKIRTYWKPRYNPLDTKENSYFIDTAFELYRKALRKRLPSDKAEEIILPLSGGLDSRLLLGSISGDRPNIKIYTHGQRSCLDYKIAQKVASTLHRSHSHELIEIDPEWIPAHAYETVWLNEGQADFTNGILLGIAKNIGMGKKTFINGIIGAHLSLGSLNFFSHDEIIQTRRIKNIHEKIFSTLGFSSHKFFPFFLRDDFIKHFCDVSKENA
ncbi:MAG: hypothetical protein ACP5EQ_07240, partial [Candidatus Cloacimonadia bacterium]